MDPELIEEVKLDVNQKLGRRNEESHRQIKHLQRINGGHLDMESISEDRTTILDLHT
jgi:hypothetical protein